MKSIIDGKTYNTDTSSVVARYDYIDDDGYDTDAVVYVTRGGALFAVHEWRVPDEDAEGGVRVKRYVETLTRDQLDRLVARGGIRGGQFEIVDETLVAAPPEAAAEEEPGATIYVRVPASLKRRVDEAARGANVSINAWALRCLETCLGPRLVNDSAPS